MKIEVRSTYAEKSHRSCIILGVFEGGELTPSAKRVDQLSKGALKKLIKQSGFQAKPGQTLPIFNLSNTKFEQILLVGFGDPKRISRLAFARNVIASTRALSLYAAVNAISYLIEIPVKGNPSSEWKVKQITQGTLNALYRFDIFKTQKDPKPVLKTLVINITKNDSVKACQSALNHGQAIAAGMTFAKNLGNLPSNICTPKYLAQVAKELSKSYRGMSIKVLGEKEMHKLGMGGILAVAQGSAEPPQLVCLEYRGAGKKTAPIAFVGKGVTFDTGGNSIKPADNMVGMKYDMCGAATVLGMFKTVAELKLPINLVGVLPIVENMPGGNAYKPEDIITTMSGQTVEVISTDAEGRLILADALTYCERYKPKTVIDIATLTGATVIALGFQTTALLTPDDALAKELVAAGNESNDRAWQLPLFEEYQEQIRSPFADMCNAGGRPAGAIIAACFLSRFAKKYSWAHLDVAGTAAMMIGGNDRMATGRPIPMLVQFLLNRIDQHATN